MPNPLDATATTTGKISLQDEVTRLNTQIDWLRSRYPDRYAKLLRQISEEVEVLLARIEQDGARPGEKYPYLEGLLAKAQDCCNES